MTDTVMEYAWCHPREDGWSSYRQLCRAAKVPPVPSGIAMLFCVDDEGQRWTRLSLDYEYLQMWLSTGDVSVSVNKDGVLRPSKEGLMSINSELLSEKFPIRRRGWADEWR